MRKTPIKHHVRKHKRKGRPVIDYDRGKGSHPNIAKPNLRKMNHSIIDFNVRIIYLNLPAEVFPVKAPSYPEAIELALSVRRHITVPYQIDVKKT